MPLGSQFSSLMLLFSNLDRTNPTIYKPQKEKIDKPLIFPRNSKINFLPRCSPSEVGIKDEYVESFFNDMSLDYSVRINRMLLVSKEGKVIGERYSFPYTKDSWDCVFSATKTIICLALGILYDEGKIDLNKPVWEILELKKVGNGANKTLTLKHLLTHTSGNTFNEMESVMSLRWVNDFFASGQKFKIGSKFEYNSMNTYIISAVIAKITEMITSDFIRERIFNPLGISDTHMETSFEGITKGGWGLYILPEDMAKIGVLFLNNGKYNNQQIVSEEWINLMSKKQVQATKYGHRFDYGYQMWVDEDKNFTLVNGLYDQDILIFKKTGLALVVCGSSPEAFHATNIYDIAFKYFVDINYDLPVITEVGDKELRNVSSLKWYYDAIANKVYYPMDKIANSCSMLPMLMQNSLSTYAKGMKEMSFKYIDNKYYFYVKEDDKDYNIEFNFDRGVRQTLTFYKNVFDCVCDAKFFLNAKSNPFLAIRLFFLEFSSTRYITVKFDKYFDVLSIELSESPGLDFVSSLVEIQDEGTKALVTNAIKLMNPAIFKSAVRKIFSPRFRVIEATKLEELKPKKK